MKLPELLGTLKALEWRYETRANDTGGTLVALERGGRIIGLYPDPEGGNLLWTCPDIASPETARKKYDTDKHWNTGGERTWLSPEISYFVRDPNDPSSYVVQEGIDPGRYVFADAGGIGRAGVKWTQRSTATDYRATGDFAFRLSKSCELAPNPMSAEDTGKCRFVGYETVTELHAPGEGTSGSRLSLWTLLQVPSGGEAVVPVFGTVRPTDFFAPTGPELLTVEEGRVRFRIGGSTRSHKLSMKAEDVRGLIGYAREGEGDTRTLIVQRIERDPKCEYGDVPLSDTGDEGHCIQLYSDDGSIGPFGELEHHSPLLQSVRDGARYRSIRSSVWAYAGSAEQIGKIAKKLLEL